ncbi:hypothetical protein WR25_15708 [Diploscapter pachys]|uniref:Uncharacterized protein n=1 Tax=Diploscapter pachys TaxID=2018661 RepID=A0A2A2J3P0_9BILA|nr:hypothetical protein WR25_15708 [Diploscapter pachys]
MMMAPLQPNQMRRDWRGINSSTRVYMQRDYEISDDLQRKRIEVLENRYGGRSRAHHAATVIQRAFRDWRMKNRWRQITQTNAHRVVSLPRLGQANRIRSSSRQASLANGCGSRYPPSISLSAQLRAARSAHLSPSRSAVLTNSRRSPPSPAPSKSHPINHSTTMIG